MTHSSRFLTGVPQVLCQAEGAPGENAGSHAPSVQQRVGTTPQTHNLHPSHPHLDLRRCRRGVVVQARWQDDDDEEAHVQEGKITLRAFWQMHSASLKFG